MNLSPRKQATLPLEEDTEVVQTCSFCGKASTASLAGTDGWIVIGHDKKAYRVMCVDCQKDKKR